MTTTTRMAAGPCTKTIATPFGTAQASFAEDEAGAVGSGEGGPLRPNQVKRKTRSLSSS